MTEYILLHIKSDRMKNVTDPPPRVKYQRSEVKGQRSDITS